MNLAAAINTRLMGDGTLVAMLAEYQGGPAIFTRDPAPGDADLPYIVSAGNVLDSPWDTKTDRGRRVWRDVRCYAGVGATLLVDEIAERVRALLHRHKLEVEDHETIIAECAGPVKADEEDACGRVVTVKLSLQEV